MADKQFKVGDRVRVVSDSEWAGVCGTVTKVDSFVYFAADVGSRYVSGDLLPTHYTAPNGEAGFGRNRLGLIETVLPADWAIERALTILGYSVTLEYVKRQNTGYRSVFRLAEYIEQHEQPPVAPELLAARQYWSDKLGSEDYKNKYLSGKWDNYPSIRGFLAGAEYAWNNPKK